MNEIETLIDSALAARRAEKERTHQAQIAADHANEKRREGEVQELIEWLRTWMPAALIPCVNLDGYSHEAARYNNYGQIPIKGTPLKIQVEGAFPILFKVYKTGDEFELVKPHGAGVFAIPSAKVLQDDDGDPYISYEWPNRGQTSDVLFALGEAVEMWHEHNGRLANEIAALVDAVKNPPPPEPEPEPLTIDERIALALERAADALEGIVSHMYVFS